MSTTHPHSPDAPEQSICNSLQRCLPPPVLAPFIDNFQLLEITAAGPLPRLLPGTGALCCFVSGAPLAVDDVHSAEHRHLSRAFLLCNRHHVLDLAATGPSRLVLVSFRPGRLRYFSPASFAELQDHITDAADLWGSSASLMAEQLEEAVDLEACRLRLSAFLSAMLPRPGEARLDLMLDLLYLSPSMRIADLAAGAGWSMRHFERMFASTYGVTPKFFARVARLQQVARKLALEPDCTAGSSALDAGFFDQSHFIHELDKLAGLSTVEFVRGVRERPHFYNPMARQRYLALLNDRLDTTAFRSHSDWLSPHARSVVSR
ncbi:helix-turn-helix transcriptional regulator [Uliginosibacterium sp. H1]|uniref:helix-turn-helix transcriptional regulator n=1 Tax=Uliginosibacterium sp. H1 TaxID=3114757 RepID=UPI002E189289|nr:helix-turn-helix domain-containing protein [Uliginosibacterium sp. H1]